MDEGNESTNIVSEFSAYHFDRSVLTSAQTTNTPEKPRLPYVPLFTPSKRVSITQSPVRATFSYSETVSNFTMPTNNGSD